MRKNLAKRETRKKTGIEKIGEGEKYKRENKKTKKELRHVEQQREYLQNIQKVFSATARRRALDKKYLCGFYDFVWFFYMRQMFLVR